MRHDGEEIAKEIGIIMVGLLYSLFWDIANLLFLKLWIYIDNGLLRWCGIHIARLKGEIAL